jgi:hypothetical protein
MNPRPFPSQPGRVFGHKVLRPLDIPIGDRAYDLNRFMCGEVDSQYGTSFPDMDVRRRMIEGIDSHFESGFAKDRRHDT